MKRKTTLILAVMAAVFSVVFSGCTLRVTMNPSSAFEATNGQIPCRIMLLLNAEFQNYRWQTFSAAELQSIDYNLGSASKYFFIDSLKRASAGVIPVESRPAYPLPEECFPVLVVEPRIAGFSEKHNAFIRNANYDAFITYHIVVYDRTGKAVMEKDYAAGGTEMGSTDLSRNFAAPAERAMAEAMRLIISDLSALASRLNRPDKARRGCPDSDDRSRKPPAGSGI